MHRVVKEETEIVGASGDALNNLTPVLMRTFKGVAEGKTNKEMAADDRISERGVKDRVSRMFQALGIMKRSQVLRFFGPHTAVASQVAVSNTVEEKSPVT